MEERDMNVNKAVVKKSLKVAGAFAAATGVVAISALVASGAAVGAVAEGFKEAGKVVKKSLEKEKKTEASQDFLENETAAVDVEMPMAEELVKTEEVDKEEIAEVSEV